MSQYLFDPAKSISIAVKGETARYPVNRIFCVGRNYAAHAAEMGEAVDREAPIYFCKTAIDAIHSGDVLPYPPGTQNLHFEMELAVALGAPVFKGNKDQVADAIYGYGCGLDMTRRDLQQASRGKGRPWDTGKNFEGAAVLSSLVKAAQVSGIGPQRIHLDLNSKTKQDAHLSDMIWSVEEIISDLSHLYHLVPGDIILTGTPAGVEAIGPGDLIEGHIEEIGSITLTIGEAT